MVVLVAALSPARLPQERSARSHGTRQDVGGSSDLAHRVGRLERPRAERVQEGRRRVRRGKHPDVDVKVVGGINDDKIIAALRGGNAPDVVSSFTSVNVGTYCPSGGWIDLEPYMKQDGSTRTIFPASTRTTRSTRASAARCRCSPTSTASTTTRTLLQEGRPDRAAEDGRELTAYAKKLTTKNADGSLKVVGFDPFFGFYQNTPGVVRDAVRRASGSTADGKSSLARTRPGRSC